MQLQGVRTQHAVHSVHVPEQGRCRPQLSMVRDLAARQKMLQTRLIARPQERPLAALAPSAAMKRVRRKPNSLTSLCRALDCTSAPKQQPAVMPTGSQTDCTQMIRQL